MFLEMLGIQRRIAAKKSQALCQPIIMESCGAGLAHFARLKKSRPFSPNHGT